MTNLPNAPEPPVFTPELLLMYFADTPLIPPGPGPYTLPHQAPPQQAGCSLQTPSCQVTTSPLRIHPCPGNFHPIPQGNPPTSEKP